MPGPSLHSLSCDQESVLVLWSLKTSDWMLENTNLVFGLRQHLPENVQVKVAGLTDQLVECFDSVQLTDGPKDVCQKLNRTLQASQINAGPEPVGLLVALVMDSLAFRPVPEEKKEMHIIGQQFLFRVYQEDAIFIRSTFSMAPQWIGVSFKVKALDLCRTGNTTEVHEALSELWCQLQSSPVLPRRPLARILLSGWQSVAYWLAVTSVLLGSTSGSESPNRLKEFSSALRLLVFIFSCSSSRLQTSNSIADFLASSLYTILLKAVHQFPLPTASVTDVYLNGLANVNCLGTSIAHNLHNFFITDFILCIYDQLIILCVYQLHLPKPREQEFWDLVFKSDLTDSLEAWIHYWLVMDKNGIVFPDPIND